MRSKLKPKHAGFSKYCLNLQYVCFKFVVFIVALFSHIFASVWHNVGDITVLHCVFIYPVLITACLLFSQLMFSPLPFSPVSGTFPVLLQLPNGQTMPVAIPASITSSSVHIPTTIPVSILLLIFSISDGEIRSWDIFSDATLSQWIVVLCCILYQLRNIVNCWVVHVENIRHRTVTLLHMFSHAIIFHSVTTICNLIHAGNN